MSKSQRLGALIAIGLPLATSMTTSLIVVELVFSDFKYSQPLGSSVTLKI
ncbi:hypothetical protein B0O79_3846 [Flavobacteriaceae bacterium MAR_2009_75]|nr:hypothetical protein B0O79_3846 [Flavobacteriaceae bacterium MAR_2009_75]